MFFFMSRGNKHFHEKRSEAKMDGRRKRKDGMGKREEHLDFKKSHKGLLRATLVGWRPSLSG